MGNIMEMGNHEHKNIMVFGDGFLRKFMVVVHEWATSDVIIHGDKRLPLYSRVIDAQSPIAIVIPSGGSSFGIKLRDGDISWLEFLAKVEHFRQELFYICLILIL
ncbi:putative acyl-activating enzyme 17, peroxisomal [Camellia lanceoleosa]|uniref:Acyl-activating enzyme 17, peroxisomal n=1 Tax=Camellia lanceoleosa TaxID=1840588 RepID=A0ACC0FY51_9ERIC|nr:putative acyl-activating enzyme 17, peroxisomal [Camellia lanceoleosa]